MRVVFMGTPQLAATILEELAAHYEVAGVFTRPDAVRGRGKKLVASPVKQAAIECGIPVFTPTNLTDGEALGVLEELAPDCICVAAYGCILPASILDLPRYGCLNVHTSLLPRWRGAAPIERAILARDATTGVCIMRMETGLDTGAYCARTEMKVDELYLDALTEALAAEGASALVHALAQLEAGTASWSEQGESGLTYAEKIHKGELDFAPGETVAAICAKVRASSDSHPSRIEIAGRRVSVLQAEPVDAATLVLNGTMQPGDAVFASKRLVIAAGDGLVELKLVKPDGKKAMDGRAFAAGIQGIKNMNVQWGIA